MRSCWDHRELMSINNTLTKKNYFKLCKVENLFVLVDYSCFRRSTFKCSHHHHQHHCGTFFASEISSHHHRHLWCCWCFFPHCCLLCCVSTAQIERISGRYLRSTHFMHAEKNMKKFWVEVRKLVQLFSPWYSVLDLVHRKNYAKLPFSSQCCDDDDDEVYGRGMQKIENIPSPRNYLFSRNLAILLYLFGRL